MIIVWGHILRSKSKHIFCSAAPALVLKGSQNSTHSQHVADWQYPDSTWQNIADNVRHTKSPITYFRNKFEVRRIYDVPCNWVCSRPPDRQRSDSASMIRYLQYNPPTSIHAVSSFHVCKSLGLLNCVHINRLSRCRYRTARRHKLAL